MGIHASVDRDVDSRSARLLVDVPCRRRVGGGRRDKRVTAPAFSIDFTGADI